MKKLCAAFNRLKPQNNSVSALTHVTQFRGVAIGTLAMVALMLACLPVSRALNPDVFPGPFPQVSAEMPRLTVPVGSGGTITNIINVVATNTVTPITLAVEGGLPTGVTSAILSGTNNFLEPGGSMILEVTYDSTVPQTGTNEIGILAMGDHTYRLPVPIHSAKIWAGDTNNNQWTTAGHWSSAGVPGASDVVVLTSSGASVNGTNSVTNVLITANQTVAGVRFKHGDETDDQDYGVVIQSGATLSVTGDSGFSLLQDTVRSGGDIGVTFSGGGSLVVSNAGANFALLKDGAGGNQGRSILDMGGLDSFSVDVDRVGLGEYQIYPNYETNGALQPSRFVPWVTLARTNIIRATHVDPNNYTNAMRREYALSLANNETIHGDTTDAQRFFILLGETNAFLMDSIVVAGSIGKSDSATRGMRFNTDTNISGPVPTAFFRGADGVSRMSVFAIGDHSGPSVSTSASKGLVDFSLGTVDALVDRLYIGRDRQESWDNDVGQGELTMGAGVFDVNTAYVGAQEQGNNAWVATPPGAVPAEDLSGEVRGELNLSQGTIRVNDTLHIGYTTADGNDPRQVSQGRAAVTVTDGGVLMASNIFVGGVTRASTDNTMSVTSGAELIVTNSIGQTNKSLATLSMSDSTLTLHVNGAKTTPYAYTDEVITGGSGNTIKLAAIVNVGSFPTQLPLISYTSASPNFGVTLPSGFYGYIVNNTDSNTIDVVILDTPPANLVWDGTPGTTWDTSSANWQGSLVFANGDTARFDDTATSPSVDIPGAVFIGGSGVLVTNSSLAYSIDGAGTIGGTSPMNKWGTGSLAVNVASGLPLNLHEGMVTGSGAIGSTSVSSNGTLSFSGAVTRLNSSGSATILAGGSVANGVVVSGGSLTNAGTINGELDVTGSNTLAELSASGTVTLSVGGTSEIGEGAILDLEGIWNNGVLSGPNGTYRIDVLGTMTGTGSIKTGSPDISHATGDAPDYWSRLVINSGGVLSPGAAPGSLTVFTTESQVDFSPGSTIILDVDMDSADGSNPKGNAPTGSTGAKNSDVIFTSRWSTRTGTLQMNNVGVAPWAVGTVLKVFSKPFEEFGGGFRNRVFDGVTNQVPVMDPASPGAGMLWNLQEFSTNGVITIDGTASSPPVLGAVPFQGTNITFSWPTGYQGWELQSQANPLDVGLSTNWGVVTTVDSATNTSYTITNWISDELELKVYRMAHPEFE